MKPIVFGSSEYRYCPDAVAFFVKDTNTGTESKQEILQVIKKFKDIGELTTLGRELGWTKPLVTQRQINEFVRKLTESGEDKLVYVGADDDPEIVFLVSDKMKSNSAIAYEVLNRRLNYLCELTFGTGQEELAELKARKKFIKHSIINCSKPSDAMQYLLQKYEDTDLHITEVDVSYFPSKKPYFRQDFNNQLHEGEFPLWQEIMRSYRNPLHRYIFMWYVGKMFTPNTHTRVSVAMCGQGNTGKSTQVRTIAEYMKTVLSDKSALVFPTTADMQYFTGIEEARLMYEPDLAIDRRGIVQEAWFKNTTGGDTFITRQIREKPREVRSYALHLIATNFEPFVDLGKPEEYSRLLTIDHYATTDLTGLSGDVKQRYARELFDQTEAFVEFCKETVHPELDDLFTQVRYAKLHNELRNLNRVQPDVKPLTLYAYMIADALAQPSDSQTTWDTVSKLECHIREELAGQLGITNVKPYQRLISTVSDRLNKLYPDGYELVYGYDKVQLNLGEFSARYKQGVIGEMKELLLPYKEAFNMIEGELWS